MPREPLLSPPELHVPPLPRRSCWGAEVHGGLIQVGRDGRAEMLRAKGRASSQLLFREAQKCEAEFVTNTAHREDHAVAGVSLWRWRAEVEVDSLRGVGLRESKGENSVMASKHWGAKWHAQPPVGAIRGCDVKPNVGVGVLVRKRTACRSRRHVAMSGVSSSCERLQMIFICRHRAHDDQGLALVLCCDHAFAQPRQRLSASFRSRISGTLHASPDPLVSS